MHKFLKCLFCTLLALFMSIGGLPMRAAAEETGTAVPAAAVDLKDGDRVVIYNPESGMALSQEYDGFYNKGIAVTMTDGVLTGFGDTEIWTVNISTNEDGSVYYTFATAEGQKLSMGEQYSSMPLDDVYTGWTISNSNTEDAYYITNIGRNVYVEWYASKNYWSGYGKITEATEGAFAQKFFVVEDEVEPEPAAEGFVSPDVLKDGDQVVIYNREAGVVLSQTYDGFYNAGTPVTEADGKLEGYTDADVWTVGVTEGEDGKIYTFATAEGQKFSMGEQYSSMPLDDVYTEWSIGPSNTEDAYYITNIGRNVYVEWYASKNYWSGYGKITEATEGAFAQMFYLISEEEPEPQPAAEGFVSPDVLKDGDQVVIYNRESGVVLSQTYDGFYNSGTPVTEADGKLEGYTDADVWTVGVTEGEDGKVYTFATAEGQKFSMGEQYSSMPLDDVYTEWSIGPSNTEDAYYITNIGRNVYVEWYAAKNYWSGYGKITETTEGAFAQMFYLVGETEPEVEDGFVSADALKDGDEVVVYNRESGVVLSQTYDGFYNAGTPVTEADGKLEGYTNADIWTVGVTEGEDGKVYTFATAEGQKFSMGEQYSSMPLDDVYTEWTIGPSNTEDMYYIKNTGRNVYVEWYAARNYWSGYGKITEETEGAFAQMFYLTKREEELPPEEGVLKDGDAVVIYNPGAEAVFGPLNDMGNSLTPVAAVINDGYAETENGALIFNVSANDEIYAFETGGKYLATNNDEDLFLSDELSDTTENCTYWTLEQVGDGYVIYSKTAKYKTSAVCIEFFSGYFSGWTYKASTPELFVNQFYPVKEGTPVYNGMVNDPKITFTGPDTVIKGDVYKGSFVLDDLRDVELTVSADINGLELHLEKTGEKEYSFTIGAETTETASAITVHAKAADPEGSSYEGTFTITVKDEVLFLNNTPAANAETGADKRPVISVEVKNAGEGFTFEMLVKGVKVDAVYNDGVISYTPAEDLADGRTTVNVTVTRQDGEVFAKSWSFFVGAATEQLYFGQLHSHTQYSDGSGSLESALEYIANLPESANIDFVAFTDHSNYFDTTSAANPEQALYDMSLASASSQEIWQSYKDATDKFNETHDDLIAISGFEMTWSGGPGHINTFNTPGIVSRNNATLNNKTNDAGMKAYYALLSQNEGIDSLSQFNHPGTTFGTFSDFAYWDAVIDSRVYMVEVGNGEGQIGQGGYYPSYEHYTMALDKGWHLAPTNNQDNHKGRWGNANDARDVILTDDFTEQGIYDAIRAMRMYATEDKNLEIYYTVNDLPLGTTISEVPEELNFKIAVSDPDATDSVVKVELIVNSGKTVYAWEDEKEIQAGDLTVALSPDYSYYYVRVTEKDGDLAVTAPVWVGETLKLGISSLDCSVAMPVTDEELTLTTTLFNSEAIDASVKSVVYTINGSVVIGTDTTGYTLPAGGTLEIPFNYTPTEARVIKVTSTVVLEQDGKEFTYSKDITLDVMDADKLVYIGIDASHHNEYVNGNYKDSMGNFGLLATEYSVRTNQLNTSEDLIAACSNEKYKAIILTAPSRRDGISLRDPYENYSDEEIAALKQFNEDGGIVILAGWSDYYESYAEFPEEDHMSAQQNKVLAALGSKLRIADDGTNDDLLNGGQTQRLYFSTYNFDNPLNEGVVVDPENPNDRKYTEVFSHYGGASIYVVDDNGNPTSEIAETISPMVYGHASTYSTNADNCGVGGDAVPKYDVGEGDERLMIMATEQIGEQGLIIVSGAAFMSNFEVQASVSSGTSDADQQYNYSNYRICENILKGLNSPVIDTIATVKAVTEEGYKFTIEGIVTSNASGYDKNTAFFDCIYIQDETGGLCIFPVSGNFKVGDRVRVTGTTDWYQGEPELQVLSITLLDENNEVTPKDVTAEQINDLSVLGELIRIKGRVVSHEVVNELIQTIMVEDENGDVARVFIDGYICADSEVENLTDGCDIEVVGLSSYDDTFNAPEGPFPRIRIRNRADIICTPHVDPLAVTEITGTTELTEGEELSLEAKAEGGAVPYTWQFSMDGEVVQEFGESAVFTCTPEAGTHAVVAEVKDAEGNTASLSIEITVTPSASEYKVTLAAGLHGAIDPEGEITALEGEEITVTLIPDEGYLLEAVLVNGDLVAVENNTLVLTVTADTDVKAFFTDDPDYKPEEPVKKYKVTLVKEGEGIAETDAEEVEYGAEVRVDYRPAEGYVIRTVTANGKEINYGESTAFVTVREDTEIVVSFRILHIEFYKEHWYENGEIQGRYGDPKNVTDEFFDQVERGREIYDPATDAWYWLDALYDGHVARNKEVYIPYIFQGEDPATEGKWVRYDENGRMIKGWYIAENGNVYYYDQLTGAMAKGTVTINGTEYEFDPVTGVRK